MNPTISIIIVNYNSGRMLYNCVNSIKKYVSKVDYEIIIVDNHSTDHSILLIENQYDDIKVIKNSENYGFARANNIGLKNAYGNFILFLNNDTLFIEDTLSKLLSNLHKYQEKFLLGVKLVYPNGNYQVSAYKFPNIIRTFFANFFIDKIFKKTSKFQKEYFGLETNKKSISVDYVFGAFMLIPKPFIDHLGGFDERFYFYHEDMDLCKRVYLSNGIVFYESGLRIIHIGGGTTKDFPWFKIKNKFEARIKFYQKYFNSWKFIIILLIEYTGNIIRIPIFLIFGLLNVRKKIIMRAFYHFKVLFYYPKNNF